MKETQRIKELVTSYLNNTINGVTLLKVHTLNDNGIWQMYGEDPDCHTEILNLPDFLLVTVQGSLEQALKVAMGYPSFYAMGCGGKVRKVLIDVTYHNGSLS